MLIIMSEIWTNGINTEFGFLFLLTHIIKMVINSFISRDLHQYSVFKELLYEMIEIQAQCRADVIHYINWLSVKHVLFDNSYLERDKWSGHKNCFHCFWAPQIFNFFFSLPSFTQNSILYWLINIITLNLHVEIIIGVIIKTLIGWDKILEGKKFDIEW